MPPTAHKHGGPHKFKISRITMGASQIKLHPHCFHLIASMWPWYGNRGTMASLCVASDLMLGSKWWCGGAVVVPNRSVSILRGCGATVKKQTLTVALNLNPTPPEVPLTLALFPCSSLPSAVVAAFVELSALTLRASLSQPTPPHPTLCPPSSPGAKPLLPLRLLL